MTKSEFEDAIKKHSEGEIAKLLRDSGAFGDLYVYGLNCSQIFYLKNFYEAQTGKKAEDLFNADE